MTSTVAEQMNGLPYWQAVKEVEKEILKKISTEPNQSAEAIYIMSLGIRRTDYSKAVGGMVVLVKLRRAAQLLTEGTHRLCQPDEITEYLRVENGKRDEALRVRAAGQNTMAPNINVPNVLKG
jgi:hypothetical protein